VRFRFDFSVRIVSELSQCLKCDHLWCHFKFNGCNYVKRWISYLLFAHEFNGVFFDFALGHWDTILWWEVRRSVICCGFYTRKLDVLEEHLARNVEVKVGVHNMEGWRS